MFLATVVVVLGLELRGTVAGVAALPRRATREAVAFVASGEPEAIDSSFEASLVFFLSASNRITRNTLLQANTPNANL